MHSAIVRVKELLEYSYHVYFCVLGCKMIVFLLVQCKYIYLQQQHEKLSTLSNQTSVERFEESERRIDEMRVYMRDIGMIYRETSAAGVMIYSFFGFCIIFYYILEHYGTKYSLLAHWRRGLVPFMRNPEKESQLICEDIEESIKRVTISNINCANALAMAPTGSRSQWIRMANCDLCKTTHTPHKRACFIRKRHKQSCRTIMKTNEDLSKQLSFLLLLMSNKSALWPPNRTLCWRGELKKLYLICIYFFIFSGCITFQALYTNFHENARKALETNLDQKSKELRSFSPTERLVICEEHLMIMQCAWHFGLPALVTAIAIFDQLKFLNHLKNKFKSVLPELLALQELLCGAMRTFKGFSTLEQNNASMAKQEEIARNEEEERLRLECDKLAIELYLVMDLYIKEKNQLLKVVSHSMDRFLAYLLCTTAFSIYFLPQARGAHIFTMGFAFAVVWLAVIGLFGLCAYLHSASTRVVGLIWSLLAAITINPAGQNLVTSPSGTMFFIDTDIRLAGCEMKDQNSLHATSGRDLYRESLTLTPHTFYLWQRLIKNHQILIDGFLIKPLGGMCKLDANGVLRIHFWLISAVLIFLTYFDKL